MAPAEGIEPSKLRLTTGRLTIRLRWNRKEDSAWRESRNTATNVTRRPRAQARRTTRCARESGDLGRKRSAGANRPSVLASNCQRSVPRACGNHVLEARRIHSRSPPASMWRVHVGSGGRDRTALLVSETSVLPLNDPGVSVGSEGVEPSLHRVRAGCASTTLRACFCDRFLRDLLEGVASVRSTTKRCPRARYDS